MRRCKRAVLVAVAGLLTSLCGCAAIIEITPVPTLTPMPPFPTPVPTTTPVPTLTPLPDTALLLMQVTDKYNWFDMTTFYGCSSTGVGTGSVGCGMLSWELSTGATAGSSAFSFLQGLNGPAYALSTGRNSQSIDWSKRIILVLRFAVSNSTTNGVYRWYVGKHWLDDAGIPNKKGVGIQIDNLALKGLAHDGTTLTTVALATLTGSLQTYTVMIDSDGLGNVRWYLSQGNSYGAALGTTAGGPKTLGSLGHNTISSEVLNGADAAVYKVDFSHLSGVVVQ